MTAVAEDIRQLGHAVWYDREVAGGQAWWSAILQQIRECDLFVLILTSKALDSLACRAEFTYASQLGKPVLPALCDAAVRVNLLPPELSRVQFVNCCTLDKQATFGLIRALQAISKAGPPPDPLPPEPPVPISYLGGLRVQVDLQDREFTLAEQSALFIQIKGGLNAESREDAITLLRLLRSRHDLRASVADEIDGILEHEQPPQEPERKRGPRKAAPKNEPQPAEDFLARQHRPTAALRADSAETTIDLTGTADGLMSLLEEVTTTSQAQVLKTGDDSLWICVQDGKVLLVAAFKRWTSAEAKRLMAMGWEEPGKGMRGWVATALGVMGMATYGLGFGLLMHKKTRDYITTHIAVKRFPLSTPGEAAMSIVETFRVLAPAARTVVASKSTAPHP